MNINFTPKTVSFSGENLIRIKNEGSAPPEVINYLKKQAESLLELGTLSVIDRNCKAPSGSPNDYASMGAYWWPNPDTDNGLPYVRRDGERNPAVNEAVSISKFSERVFSLALAAFYFDDERYSKKAEELLVVWFINEKTKMNPNGEFAQGIPGICHGHGIGLIEYIWFVNVMDSVAILEAIGGIMEEVAEKIRMWFTDLANWMLTSENGIEEDYHHNNHGAWFDVQILAMARFTNRKNLATKICINALDNRHRKHIRPDGSMPYELERTRGIHYSIYGIKALLKIGIMAKLCGDERYIADESDGPALLKRAIDYIVPYATRRLPFPYKEIKMNTIDYSLGEMLLLADALFPSMGYKEQAEPYLTEDMLLRLTM